MKFTRRQILSGPGAGLATAALGIISFSSSKAYSSGTWDYESDVVVVGSGIGGATAAFKANQNQDSVIVVEKAAFFGGTSMKTAGVIWVPNNFSLRDKGIKDSKKECIQLLARHSYPEQYNAESENLGLTTAAYAMLEAFYDNAYQAADELKDQGGLRLAEWRMFGTDRDTTDYLDHVSENKTPHGRALGVLNESGQSGTGGDLMAQMEAALIKQRVPILLEHAAEKLVLDNNGRVIGIEAMSKGKTVSIRAIKGVIFASGGYAHNTKSIAAYQRNNIYGSCSMPSATGDFIDIASAAGARLGNLSGAWRSQVVLEESLDSRVLGGGVFYPPGDSMIQVNKYGVRAVNEHRNYNDRTEVHGIFDSTNAEYTNQLMFMVYDRRTAEAFSSVYPMPADSNDAPYVIKGDSLADLSKNIDEKLASIADKTGNVRLNSAFSKNLKSTITSFNKFARAGIDKDFSRGKAKYDTEWHPTFSPMNPGSPWPINNKPSITMHPFKGQGPYYAIILAAGALDTNGGPVIDHQARVMSRDDKPIPGLYGTGNCIASPSKEAYWGAGCPLALSMTFGYIAANAANKDVSGA